MYLGMNHTNSLRKKSITFPGVKLRLGMERARKTTARYFIGSKGRICRIYQRKINQKNFSPIIIQCFSSFQGEKSGEVSLTLGL